jgi:hypothetical protein
VRSLKSGCLKNVVPVCARDRALAGLSIKYSISTFYST